METFRIFYLLLLLSTAKRSTQNVERQGFVNSIVGMEILLKLERSLIEGTNKYIMELNSKLNRLKDAISFFKVENSKAIRSDLENPLVGIALMRRLHEDWDQWLDYLSETFGTDFMRDLNSTLRYRPSLADVRAAAEGLERIQIVYDLHIEDLAKGRLKKWRNEAELTTLDLNTIGLLIFRYGSQRNAVNWLETSLRTEFNKELYLQVFRRSIKRFYYDYKTYALKINATLKSLSDIQTVSRVNYQSFKITSPYDPLIKNLNLKLAMFKGQTSVKPVLNIYKRLCRGLRRNINNINKLFCYYKSDTPFLKIAPNKVEVLNFEPLILYFLEVITKKNILSLKKISKHRMKSAVAFGKNSTKIQVAGAFKLDSFTAGSFKAQQWRYKLQAIFGFRFTDVEAPEILNYGIGGHYGLHYDNVPINKEEHNKHGQRYISMNFHLNNVIQGGATIFPLLDLPIFPRKRAALVWFNIRSDGFKDYRTMHASCPVVQGSKWVLTQWIHKHEIADAYSYQNVDSDCKPVTRK